MKIIQTDAFKQARQNYIEALQDEIEGRKIELEGLQQQMALLKSGTVVGNGLIAAPPTGNRKPGRPANVGAKPLSMAPAKSKDGKRGRRKPEQLKQQAEAIANFIMQGEDDGRTGKEIHTKFPNVVQGGSTIQKFVMQYGGTKITTTGKGPQTKYFNVKG